MDVYNASKCCLDRQLTRSWIPLRADLSKKCTLLYWAYTVDREKRARFVIHFSTSLGITVFCLSIAVPFIFSPSATTNAIFFYTIPGATYGYLTCSRHNGCSSWIPLNTLVCAETGNHYIVWDDTCVSFYTLCTTTLTLSLNLIFTPVFSHKTQ